MEDKFWIALIAAGSSVVIAIISLVTAIVSSRATGRSAIALEAMKQHFISASETKVARRSELAKSVESVRIALQAIQLMKDEILLVSSSTSDSLDQDEARQRLRAARKRLFEVYQNHYPLLSDNEAGALHRAKNRVVSIENDIDGTSLEFDVVRAELSEVQGILRDALTTRLLDEALASGE